MRPIIKNHRKGSVGNDGNGMVGGRWESATRLAYKDINVADLTERMTDTDKAEKFIKWLEEKIGSETFRVEAYFDVGYDHSVGIDSYCEMNEMFEPELPIYDLIEDCPLISGTEKSFITFDLASICEEEDGYELYEID